MPIFTDALDLVDSEIPLRVTKGHLIDLLLSIVDDTGAVVNITSRTYDGYVGPGGGAAAVATFSQVVNDPINGLVNLQLATAAIPAGTYRWEVWEDTTNFLWGGPMTIEDRQVVP